MQTKATRSVRPASSGGQGNESCIQIASPAAASANIGGLAALPELLPDDGHALEHRPVLKSPCMIGTESDGGGCAGTVVPLVCYGRIGIGADWAAALNAIAAVSRAAARNQVTVGMDCAVFGRRSDALETPHRARRLPQSDVRRGKMVLVFWACCASYWHALPSAERRAYASITVAVFRSPQWQLPRGRTSC